MMAAARRLQRQSEEAELCLPEVAEVPALSCQPPSSPDQSPDAERFFDTRDDRLRRQPSRSSTGRWVPGAPAAGGARHHARVVYRQAGPACVLNADGICYRLSG